MNHPLELQVKEVNTGNTIELKKENGITYYITKLTLEEKELIIDCKNRNMLDEASNLLGIECSNIMLIGGTSKLNVSNVSRFIGVLFGPRQPYPREYVVNRPIHYRDYSRTEEQQENSIHLINLCPDIRMSVNSLKRKINSEYCCIWKRSN